MKIKQLNLLEEKIETERLLLVPTSMQYRDDIFKEFTPEITVFMYPTPAKHISKTEEFINGSLRDLKDNRSLHLVILAKDSQEFFGHASLIRIDNTIPEIGIWLKKTAHGNGFGKEAVIAMKKWADENLEYDYLLYPVADKNIPSRKIPESLGGKIEREYDKKGMGGNEYHCLEYRIYANQK